MNDNFSFLDELPESYKAYYKDVIAPNNNKTTFNGFGARVCIREGKYWLHYQSDGHGGLSIIKSISEDEYLKVRSGEISFIDLVSMYPEEVGDHQSSKQIEERWASLGIKKDG